MGEYAAVCSQLLWEGLRVGCSRWLGVYRLRGDGLRGVGVQSVDEMVKGIRDSDAFTNSSKYSLDGYNYVPTRAEKKRWASEWEKAQRFSQGGTTKELTEKVKVEVSCASRLQTPPGCRVRALISADCVSACAHRRTQVDLELKEARRLSAEEDYRNLKVCP